MTPGDLDYVKRLLSTGLIRGHVLELGVGYEGDCCRSLIEGAGLAYSGTDVATGPGVDAVADFTSKSSVESAFGSQRFGTVLALNVAEHTFDPRALLANALRLVAAGGHLVVVVPVVWPLHQYPGDYCRLLPDWFEAFARAEQVELVRSAFEYVAIGPCDSFVDHEGRRRLPRPFENTPAKATWSRGIHKIFRTFGRGMHYPSHIAIGAAFLSRGASPV